MCGPLRVPTTYELYAPAPAPGSLTFYGSFALSIGGDENGSEVYLERCGTHLHRLLTTAPLERPAVVGANTHEVVWMAHPGRFLSALTLPGLRPFTIRLPNRLIARTCSPEDCSTCVAQIALANQRLYVLTADPYHPHLLVTPTVSAHRCVQAGLPLLAAVRSSHTRSREASAGWLSTVDKRGPRHSMCRTDEPAGTLRR
jgi:hypothetical protein